jgi:hypothetical protein
MVKMQAVYERRQRFPFAEKGAGEERPPGGKPIPDGTDLSVPCERLFVSGLPSSRIAEKGEKEDQNDG